MQSKNAPNMSYLSGFSSAHVWIVMVLSMQFGACLCHVISSFHYYEHFYYVLSIHLLSLSISIFLDLS